MRKIFTVVESFIYNYEELGQIYKDLLLEALLARESAQAPYSHYKVGAAVESAKTGKVYLGCNVECASWTQTTHAEQVAICSMVVVERSVKIKRIAVIGEPEDKIIKWPPEKSESSVKEVDEVCHACGHCLQIIWENCFNDPAVELITLLPTGEIAISEIGHAFPMRFGPKELGVALIKTPPT